MPSKVSLLTAVLPIALVSGLWVFGWRRQQPFGIFGVYPIAHFAAYVAVTGAGLAVAYVALGRGRPARRIRTFQVAGLFSALVFCAVALELPAALKLVDYRAFLGYSEDWDPVHNQVDPELITTHLPRGRLHGQFTGAYVHSLGVPPRQAYDVEVRWDGHGFRNSYDCATADVVVLGDSFVESPLVPLEDIATSRLARQLNATVLNLGQSGFGPQQELITLQRHGLAVAPKLVTWVLYEGNDFGDAVTYQSIMAEGVAAWARSHDTFWKRSLTRSVLTWGAQRTRQDAVWKAFGSRLYGTLKPAGAWQGERMYFSHNRQLGPVENPAAVDCVRDCILRARQACAARGTKFALVFAPEPFRAYHDLVDAGPVSELRHWQINELPERLGEWARNEGIPYLNLTPMLRQAAAEGTLVYFLDDPHWTAAGNAVVGNALASFCAQHLDYLQGDPPARFKASYQHPGRGARD